MIPKCVLEVNHPDEVFNKFYDAGYQRQTWKSYIWTHSLSSISSMKESKTNGCLSLKKEMWQIAHTLQCFEGFLLTGLPNRNSPSVSITFTFSDFSASEVALSHIFPSSFLPPTDMAGTHSCSVCSASTHTVRASAPAPFHRFLSHIRNLAGVGLEGSREA